MARKSGKAQKEQWRRRLFVPCYQVGEAARYAHVSPQTVGKWHKATEQHGPVLSSRDARAELSYMQLIEVAVLAAFRKEGLTLRTVRNAREYFAKMLQSEFPFAEYRFMTEGKDLWLDYGQIEGDADANTLLNASKGGQLGWRSIIGRLKEFEYEDGGVAVRWRVAGEKSPIIIDPRVSFGAPAVRGTPTWAIRGRWDAGESVGDIADDFGLSQKHVKEALAFEGVVPDMSRQDLWAS